VEASASLRSRLPLRRWQVVLLAAAGVLVALRVALPFALEWAVEREATRALGVPVAVGDVDLGLLVARAALEELVVGAPPGTSAPAAAGAAGAEAAPPALLRCQHIAVRLAPLRLLRREVRVRALEILAPELRLERAEDGRLILPAPPPPAQAPPEPEAPAPPPDDAGAAESGPGYAFLLDALAIQAARTELIEPGAARSVELDLDELTLTGVALRGEALALGAIGIRGPRVRVRHDLLLAAPAAPAPAAPAPSPEPEAGPGADVRLSELDIERAELVLATDEASLPLALRLRVREVQAEPGPRLQVSLRIEQQQGVMEAEGLVSLPELAFDGTLKSSDLALARILAVAGMTPIRVDAGQGGAELRIRAALAPKSGAPELRVSGSLGLRGVQLEDAAGAFGLGFESLELEADEVRVPIPQEGTAPQPLRVALSRLALREPALRVRRAPAAAAAPAPEAEPAAGAPVEPAPPPQISARDVAIAGGRVAFEDATVQPVFRAEVRNLELTAKELGWPERTARGLRLSARGPAGARPRVDASLGPEGGSVTLDLRGLELPALNPYLAAAGVQIDRGTFGLQGKVAAEREVTRVASELRIAALDLGRTEGGGFQSTFGVPIDVGVALLKGPSGVIELPVEFSFARDELRVALRRTLIAALQRAVAGALIAPLRGLHGAALGVGGAVASLGGALGPGLDPLPAEPGDPELAAGAEERVRELREMLAARPALRLVLRGRAGPDDDPFLAERMLAERALAGQELPELAGAGFLQRRRIRAALQDRARHEAHELAPEDAELLQRAIAAVSVPPERRAGLARARAEAARAALLADGALAAERVTSGEVEEGAPGVALALAAGES
jgi:hypothetical protein